MQGYFPVVIYVVSVKYSCYYAVSVLFLVNRMLFQEVQRRVGLQQLLQKRDKIAFDYVISIRAFNEVKETFDV